MTLLTNTLEVQSITSQLLKVGVRVFPEPVSVYDRLNNRYTIKGYVICVERLLSNGNWGQQHRFQKEISENELEDAVVKTIKYVYEKEFSKN